MLNKKSFGKLYSKQIPVVPYYKINPMILNVAFDSWCLRCLDLIPAQKPAERLRVSDRDTRDDLCNITSTILFLLRLKEVRVGV